ncbi:MAG: hypothetical protein UV38_C0005G0007 [candidate division TM6 bacterium GW2011_GWE2_42_60]|nr:MAG: hypothetical protein UV38_C0005G0007 [candidate division TM6 bacterium GW2011_GWE2_42_60]HBY05326.1 hypothetical protein [Candidatus Dependentiae bacterium]
MKKLTKILLGCCVLLGTTNPLLPALIPQPHQKPVWVKSPTLKRPDLGISYTEVRRYKTIPLGRWILDHPKTCLSAAAITFAAVAGIRYWLWCKNLNEADTLEDKLQDKFNALYSDDKNNDTKLSSSRDWMNNKNKWEKSTDFFSWLFDTRKNIENRVLSDIIIDDLSPKNVTSVPWMTYQSGDKIVFESTNIPISLTNRLYRLFDYLPHVFLGVKENGTLLPNQKHTALRNSLKNILSRWATDENLKQSIKLLSVTTTMEPYSSSEDLYEVVDAASYIEKNTVTTSTTSKKTGTKTTTYPPVTIYCADEKTLETSLRKTPNDYSLVDENITFDKEQVFIKGSGSPLLKTLTAAQAWDGVVWLTGSLLNTDDHTKQKST